MLAAGLAVAVVGTAILASGGIASHVGGRLGCIFSGDTQIPAAMPGSEASRTAVDDPVW